MDAQTKDVRDSVSFWLIISLVVILIIGWVVEGDVLIDFLVDLVSGPQVLTNPLFLSIVFPGLLYVSIVAAVAIYVERKIAAKIQIRIGPQYAGRVEGILQVVADGIKMAAKEFVIPRTVDVTFFVAAPILSLTVGMLSITVVPFSPTTVIFPFPVNLLLFFAIVSFFPLTALLAGWASNNKFSLIGAARALFQQASYEIPMLISALAPALLAGSLRIEDIVMAQKDMPFLFPAILSAIIFLAAALAETEKHPFEIPEADSEIVAGWMTEYSSMPYTLFMLAVYVKMISLSTLFTDLFLSGWLGPISLPPEAWTVVKSWIVLLIFLTVRALFPRIRIDQMLKMGWGSMLLLSVAGLFLAIALGMVVGL